MHLLSTLGAVLYVVGWLWTVVIAFKESPLWGIGCLLMPIVWLFFLFARWRKTWPCLVLAVAGAIMFFAFGGTLSS